MPQSPLLDKAYKPSFSGHETFPLRYGWLQKAFDAVSNEKAETTNVFRDPAAIARFGVGKNMVASIRHWATATSVIADDKEQGLHASEIGEMLFGKKGADRFLEEDGSLWLLHWELVSKERHTSFYWLFNEYVGGSFSRSELVAALKQLVTEREWGSVADTTIDRDIQCLVRNYVGARGGTDAGDSILSELGLVRPIGQGRFILARGQKPNLPDAVFLYALWDFWQLSAPKQSTLSFESVAFDSGSPGRAFLLDENSLVERLENLGSLTGGAISWSETAGLRQVVRRDDLDKIPVFEILRHALEGKKEEVAA